jgi:hypothetical protein
LEINGPSGGKCRGKRQDRRFAPFFGIFKQLQADFAHTIRVIA